MLKPEEGRELLKLAKGAVVSVLSGKNFEISPVLRERFGKKQGVFVTLHKNGKLRGCIGYPEPVIPLFEATARAASAAAFRDPRFPPLKRDELPEIKFEISVLTVPEKIKNSSPAQCCREIEIGRDGLIVSMGPYSGLLLPQVAVEHNMSKEEFLCCCCEKAGLHADEWKNGGCEICRFQAQVFSE